jgi:hypothetical protein
MDEGEGQYRPGPSPKFSRKKILHGKIIIIKENCIFSEWALCQKPILALSI